MLNIWYSNMLLAYSDFSIYNLHRYAFVDQNVWDGHLPSVSSQGLASISPALVLNIGQWSTSRKVNEDYGRSSLSYHWWLSIVPTFWIRYSQFVMFMINSVNSYK